MKRIFFEYLWPPLMTIMLLGGCILATSQTTQPTLQIEIRHNGKTVSVIVAEDVARRVVNGTQTDEDRAAVAVAVELALGHLGEQKANPCDKPHSRLINDGRPVVNCSDSVGQR